MLPVEAQACGTPVIAYGKGGALESVIENKTGIFFQEQTAEAIISAINEFEKIASQFDPVVIADHASAFSAQRFKDELVTYLSGIVPGMKEKK
jgi:glycosyltransferase involved in cell wall biosynthesis